jgi:hypothetical protein
VAFDVFGALRAGSKSLAWIPIQKADDEVLAVLG